MRERHKKGLQYSEILLGKCLPSTNTYNPYLMVPCLIVIQNIKGMCSIIFLDQIRKITLLYEFQFCVGNSFNFDIIKLNSTKNYLEQHSRY